MQTNKTRTARIGAVVLASCVGAGALFAASPAMALDGWDGKGTGYNPLISVSKTDSETGAPLSGTIFTVETKNPSAWYTAPGSYFDRVDPAAWSFDSAAAIPDTTVEEFVDFYIAAHNTGLAENQGIIDSLLAQILPADEIAVHEATVAEYEAARAAHEPFAEASRVVNAERQRLADEIIALQNANQPVPIELAQAHADAQQALADAIAAGQPTYAVVASLQAGANAARAALDASESAQRELNMKFPGGYLPWTPDNHGVDTTDFEAKMPAWIESQNAIRAAGVAQAACNAEWGVPTAPTLVSGEGVTAIYSYEVATCDGVGYLPPGTTPVSVTETRASEGYILDGTRHETPATSAYTFDFNGVELPFRDGVMQIENDPVEPPVDPPIEPPVEPPVTPPVAPPAPQETLATTGSDASNAPAIAGIAALLAAAGGAVHLFRRRSAAE